MLGRSAVGRRGLLVSQNLQQVIRGRRANFHSVASCLSSEMDLVKLFPPAGVYFVVCMALLVISLTETILIVRLVHKQDLQPHVPEWVKRWVLERATILLCVRDRSAFCPVRTQSSDISGNTENNDSTGETQGQNIYTVLKVLYRFSALSPPALRFQILSPLFHH